MTDRPDLDELLAAAVSAIPGGSVRPGQTRMAHAVAEAARTEEHLLVQAGTGTGKSLAYLVPALATGVKVVVATATLALQSQLVEHDLPHLVAAVEPLLRRQPRYSLLKGRQHYVCLARLEAGHVDDPANVLFDEPQWLAAAGRIGKQVTRIRDWALETTTGDRTELAPGVDDATWRLVSMPARECIGPSRCPFGDECFAEAARARARAADIVVTNHSLLAIDMAADRPILPEHSLLVVDEAHELVDRVTTATQAELTSDGLARVVRRLAPFASASLREVMDDATAALTEALLDAPVGLLTELPDELREALVTLVAAGRAGLEALGTVDGDENNAVPRNQAKSSIVTVIETAQRVLQAADHDVVWIAEDDRMRRSLVIAPLSVAALLETALFRGRTVVATSATLALGGRFETVATSFGLSLEEDRTLGNGGAGEAESAADSGIGQAESDAEPAGDPAAMPPRWRTLDVGSPFSYPEQGILYVASHLPRPGPSGLSEPARRELIDLVTAAGGRSLGLFSSRKAAAQAAEALREATDLPVLLQGEDSIYQLVRQFREEPESCLLGTNSLWQGVDIPGPACQLVVIDRIPFPRPDEPLTSARSRVVDDAGGSGFMAVSVPIAAVRLAQGVGRLLRTTGDRGVVAVLDPRLATARYGDFLRRTLPPFWYTTSSVIAREALRRLDRAE